MSVTDRYARFYSSDEILAIAERIRALVERERIIRLTPATGWLVEGAMRAYAAQPNRQTVMEIICGNSRCECLFRKLEKAPPNGQGFIRST